MQIVFSARCACRTNRRAIARVFVRLSVHQFACLAD